MEMKVWIANLGKYNEGELVGAWFTPPISFDEVKEKIGLNAEYEEYAIHDYELPFDIGEYTPIDEVNRLCAAVEDISSNEIRENLKEVISCFGFSNVEDVAEHENALIIHECSSVEDLAYSLVESGGFGEVPESLRGYIDYAAITRDMEINNSYLHLDGCIVEYVR
jgi:Antirestriction protein